MKQIAKKAWRKVTTPRFRGKTRKYIRDVTGKNIRSMNRFDKKITKRADYLSKVASPLNAGPLNFSTLGKAVRASNRQFRSIFNKSRLIDRTSRRRKQVAKVVGAGILGTGVGTAAYKLRKEEREELINNIIETTLSGNIGSYDMPMGIPVRDPSVNKVFRRRFPIIQAKIAQRGIIGTERYAR